MIDLIIFDNDGTLVDSELIGHRTMADVLAIEGIATTPEALQAEFRGRALAEQMRVLADRHETALTDAHLERYRTLLAERLEAGLQPMPGAGAAVDALAATGLMVAVASGGPMDKIRLALRVARLEEHFEDRLFSSYDIGSFKPEPDLFLHTARSLGCPAHRCLVVEDSAVGIAAAERAGMHAVLVGHAREVAHVPGLASLHELPGYVRGLRGA